MTARYSRSDIESALPGGRWQPDGEYLVRSPLREERTASFRINAEKGAWKDFGSGEGGKLSDLFRRLDIPDPWQSDTPSRKKETANIDFNALINSDDGGRAYILRRWNEASTAGDDFPYLQRKGVPAHGCRVGFDRNMGDSVLYVPAQDIKGNLVGLERIPATQGKLKQHLKQKKGAFFLIGEPEKDRPLLVAEGFATGASLHEISGLPVAVAFTWWNMVPVAAAIREKHGVDVCICPDAGEAPLKAISEGHSLGMMAVELPPESEGSLDWNDVHAEQGLEGAKETFQAQWAEAVAARSESPETKPTPERPKSRITLLHGSELRYEPREHLVKGIVQQNKFAVIYGPPGSSKTFFCLDMALSIASGQTFLGRPTKQGPVIYVGAEGSEEIAKRLDAWDAEKAALEVSYKSVPFYYVPHAVIIPQGEQREDLVASVMEKVDGELNGETPVAIFIDTLARCSEGDENSNSDMGRFVAAADEIRMRLKGATVVVVHHTPKSDPETLRGASALHGAIDSAICLVPVGTGTEQEQTLIMKCKKQKDLGQFPDEALARVQVELPYIDFYGDQETSCVIEARDELPAKEERLSRGQRAGLESYLKAAEEAPTLIAGKFAGVMLEDWRPFYYEASVADTIDAKGKAFQRARADLVEKNILGVRDDLYFPVRQAEVLLTSSYAARVKGAIWQSDEVLEGANTLTGQTGHCPDMSDMSGSQNTYQPDRPDIILEDVRCPGVLSGSKEEEKSLPCGKEKLMPSEADFNEALTWAKTQPGLLENLEEKAKLTDEPAGYFETAVKTAYVGFLNEADTSTLADMSPALSVTQIAARAGVDTEAVLEELGRWQDCGRLSVDGAGSISLLAGDAFPGDGGPDDEEADGFPERGEADASDDPEKKPATVEEWLNWADEVMVDE
jgi:hypothetical protein